MKSPRDCPHCCPFPKNRVSNVRRSGFYRRASNLERIVRYHCNGCSLNFSDSTATHEYRQRRRSINLPLFKLLASNVSMRRSAQILEINRKTVDNRLIYFGRVSEAKLAELLLSRTPSTAVQFDDVETSEHTKLKPLSVPMVVDGSSRVILSFDVVPMAAKGLLAKISVKKYGRRKDERPAGWRRVLQSAATTCVPGVKITSDMHKRYPEMIRRYLPGAVHEAELSRRSSVAGQGELKKGGNDPLFSFNHTAAMLRANICRLIRRTWCTTKKHPRLKSHIALYSYWHNESILAKREKRAVQFHFANLV